MIHVSISFSTSISLSLIFSLTLSFFPISFRVFEVQIVMVFHQKPYNGYCRWHSSARSKSFTQSKENHFVHIKKFLISHNPKHLLLNAYSYSISYIVYFRIGFLLLFVLSRAHTHGNKHKYPRTNTPDFHYIVWSIILYIPP